MTKSQKRLFNQLLIALIILTLLLSIAVLIRRRQKPADADSSSAGSVSTSQTDEVQEAAFAALAWQTEELSLSFSPGDDGVWYWDGDRDFPLDTTVIDSVMQALSPLEPVKTFAAGESLSAYGLENSACILTARYQDGKELQLTFGSQVPDSTNRYMLRSDDAAVYVVDSTIPDAMETAVYDMMKLPELPIPEDISSISLHSAGKELLVTSNDGISWLCNGADISDNQALSAVLEALSSLKLIRCENFKPSPDGLALWGMEIPAVTAEIYYGEDQLLTLQIGNETLDGSGYYVRINEDTTIYSMGTGSIEPLFTAAQQGLLPPSEADAPSGETPTE